MLGVDVPGMLCNMTREDCGSEADRGGSELDRFERSTDRVARRHT